MIELDRPIQSELAVMLDMNRRSRFGLGADATAELTVRAASSILTRAQETRHRFSLAFAQREPVIYPAGSGLAHLHLLLDRLAILEPGGEADLWEDLAPRALQLAPGSRAVFICAASNLPLEVALLLIGRLGEVGIGADCVLINDRDFFKIYRDQEKAAGGRRADFEMVRQRLQLAGARVWAIDRQRASLAGIRPELEFAELAFSRIGS